MEPITLRKENIAYLSYLSKIVDGLPEDLHNAIKKYNKKYNGLKDKPTTVTIGNYAFDQRQDGNVMVSIMKPSS